MTKENFLLFHYFCEMEIFSIHMRKKYFNIKMVLLTHTHTRLYMNVYNLTSTHLFNLSSSQKYNIFGGNKKGIKYFFLSTEFTSISLLLITLRISSGLALNRTNFFEVTYSFIFSSYLTIRGR